MRSVLRVPLETLMATIIIASFSFLLGAFVAVHAQSLRTGVLIAGTAFTSASLGFIYCVWRLHRLRNILAPLVVLFCLGAIPLSAEAGKVEGVGIGAGAGAVVAGPVGAVVGGVAGYFVGGPNIITGRRYTCWRDNRGRHRCGRR